ncbi:hypothetical protein [Haloarcula sediminis]|uniref:hypothetical protein n=1 Tax=Haloarcula sediminis TaxID=3111777 RepID=UPI002D7826F8|nr:hypothetical protein [Haloarcula sp. CK38]
MARKEYRPPPFSGKGGSKREQKESVSRVEHYVSASVGLVTVAGTVMLFGPMLLNTVQGFGVLSTTILVFVLVTLWIFVWIAIETALIWHMSRLAT